MEEFIREIETPLIKLTDDIGLTWLNCCMRTFKDSEYNHIEYYDEENIKGIRVAGWIMDLLFEHEYPYRFDPVVDDQTLNWYINTESKILEQELDEM